MYSKCCILYDKLKHSSNCQQFFSCLCFLVVLIVLIATLELFGYFFNSNVGHRTTFWVNFWQGSVLVLMSLLYVNAELGMYNQLFFVWHQLEVESGKLVSEEENENIRKLKKDADETSYISGFFLIVCYAFSWLFLYGVWHHPSTNSLNFLAGVGIFIAARLVFFLCTPAILTLIYHINKTCFHSSTESTNA